ncbi:MAG: FAD-dependent oxidoreductase, partial [Acidimicrobiales bacterium]
GATLTYDLTNLQGLPGSERYLVSLNSDEWIDESKVIKRVGYSHPVFDTAALEAQPKLRAISGTDRFHFCGAWLGYGFHEDGAASALRVCEDLGINW